MKLTRQRAEVPISKIVSEHIVGPAKPSRKRLVDLHGAGDLPAKPGRDSARMLRGK